MLKKVIGVNLTVALVVALCSGACGKKQNPNTQISSGGSSRGGSGGNSGGSGGGRSNSDAEVLVTYSDDVKVILDESCIRCHASTKSGSARDGAPTSVNLDTYESAKASAKRSNSVIQGGSMPPSGALASAKKATFKLWVDQGMLE
jgi:hypothetical protein